MIWPTSSSLSWILNIWSSASSWTPNSASPSPFNHLIYKIPSSFSSFSPRMVHLLLVLLTSRPLILIHCVFLSIIKLLINLLVIHLKLINNLSWSFFKLVFIINIVLILIIHFWIWLFLILIHHLILNILLINCYLIIFLHLIWKIPTILALLMLFL